MRKGRRLLSAWKRMEENGEGEGEGVRFALAQVMSQKEQVGQSSKSCC